MSDIPLHSIRRNKARTNYTPIRDTDSTENNMHQPARVTVMASSSTAGRNNHQAGKNAKRKGRYVDDPEEEASLLREEADEEDEDRSPTEVCFCLHPKTRRPKLQHSFLHLYYASVRKITRGQYLFGLQVGSIHFNKIPVNT